MYIPYIGLFILGVIVGVIVYGWLSGSDVRYVNDCPAARLDAATQWRNSPVQGHRNIKRER